MVLFLLRNSPIHTGVCGGDCVGGIKWLTCLRLSSLANRVLMCGSLVSKNGFLSLSSLLDPPNYSSGCEKDSEE